MPRNINRWVYVAAVVGCLAVAGVVWWSPNRGASTEGISSREQPTIPTIPTIPEVPDLDGYDPEIASAIQQADADVRGRGDQASWLRLANVYDAHEMFDLASRCYEQVVEFDPAATRAWYNLAIVRGELGDLAGAAAAMERVAEKVGTYAPVYWHVGFWYLDLGNLDVAELAFHKAVAIDTADTVGRIGVARVNLQRQQWAQAVALLEPIAAAGKQNSRYAQQLLAHAYRGLGQISDSRAASVAGAGGGLTTDDPWRDEIAQLRSGTKSKLREANRLLASGQRDQALELLAQMRRESPDEVGIPTAVATVYANAGRLAESESVLRDVLARHPNYYPAHLVLARTLAAMNEHDDEALAHLDQALELNPTLAAGHALRGELLQRRNDLAGAADSFHEAARCAPSSARYLYQAALVEMQLRRWDAAATALETVVQRLPARARIHQQLGVAYLQLKRWDEAEAAIARASELAPHDPQVRAARQQLAAERAVP